MNLKIFTAGLMLAGLMLGGCDKKADPKDEAPPTLKVEQATDVNTVHIEHPEQFPLVAAATQMTASSMNVDRTGAAGCNPRDPGDFVGFGSCCCNLRTHRRLRA